MDRRKISRSFRASTKGVNIKLRSSCAAPTLVLMEDLNPSVYEIDIFSSIDFGNGRRKKTNERPLEMSLEKAVTDILEIKGARKNKNLEIPLLESYYPSLQQSPTNIKNISYKREKMDSEIQTDSIIGARKDEERVQKPPKKKSDKENKSPSEDSQELAKTIKVEDLFLKDGSSMKILFKHLNKKLNKNQLQMHHHEHHHHHYYFDDSGPPNKNAPSVPLINIFNRSQRVRSDGESKIAKDRRCHGGGKDNKANEKELSIHNYFIRRPRESNLTFTKTSSAMIFTPESNESWKTYRTGKNKENKSSAALESPRPKFSISVETLLSKRSDFITTYIYSDTELRKCESEMMRMSAISEFDKCSVTELSKNVENEYSSILNDLTNCSRFISSNVLSDHLRGPLVSYIRCESSSVESSNAVPNDRRSHDDKNSDKTRNLLLVPVKKNEENSLQNGGDPNVWATKLKAELEEIKKELKRLEEKNLQEGKSFVSIFSYDKSIESQESSQTVVIYSNKTYLVGADGLYVMHKSEQGQFGTETSSVSQIGLAFKGTGNEREKWRFREKRSFYERAILN